MNFASYFSPSIYIIIQKIGEGEMTSEDPFVQQIDASVRGEMGVGLDELLNPAKVCECMYIL